MILTCSSPRKSVVSIELLRRRACYPLTKVGRYGHRKYCCRCYPERSIQIRRRIERIRLAGSETRITILAVSYIIGIQHAVTRLDTVAVVTLKPRVRKSIDGKHHAKGSGAPNSGCGCDACTPYVDFFCSLD